MCDNNQKIEFAKECRKFNWGAFFLDWIWGVANHCYISLWMILIRLLTPFLPIFAIADIIFRIYLGKKGNEWAIKNKKWENCEQFAEVQKKWAKWGAVIIIGAFILALLSYITIYSIIKYSKEHVKEKQTEKIETNIDDISSLDVFSLMKNFDEAIKNEVITDNKNNNFGTYNQFLNTIKFKSARMRLFYGILYSQQSVHNLSTKNAVEVLAEQKDTFVNSDKNVLIDKQNIYYYFDCKKGVCDVLVDLNGEIGPNQISSENSLKDQMQMQIKGDGARSSVSVPDWFEKNILSY